MRKLGQEVRGGSSDLRKLPSYAAALGNGDLMHEVISLMPVLIPEALAIRKDEVRHLIEAAGLSLRDDEEVPGSEGAGVFADVFPEDTPMQDEGVEQVTPMQEDEQVTPMQEDAVGQDEDAVVQEEEEAVVQEEAAGQSAPLP